MKDEVTINMALWSDTIYPGPFSNQEMQTILESFTCAKAYLNLTYPTATVERLKGFIGLLENKIMTKSSEKKEDNVNHPAHYINEQGKECIDEMQEKFGVKAVYNFCKCNEFKYLWRAGKKGPKEEDTKKAEWYHKKALQLKTDYPILFKTYD